MTVRIRHEDDRLSWALVSFRNPAGAAAAVAALTAGAASAAKKAAGKWKMAAKAVIEQEKKDKKKRPTLANISEELANLYKALVVRAVNAEQAAKSTGAMSEVMRKHMPARMRGTIAARAESDKRPQEPTEISRPIFVQARALNPAPRESRA